MGLKELVKQIALIKCSGFVEPVPLIKGDVRVAEIGQIIKGGLKKNSPSQKSLKNTYWRVILMVIKLNSIAWTVPSVNETKIVHIFHKFSNFTLEFYLFTDIIYFDNRI